MLHGKADAAGAEAAGETAESADATARRRLAPEERREEILRAALSAFAELGYDQATLNDVADRLGVTKGCLYHYFDSKEQLLLDLVREGMVRRKAEDREWVAAAPGSRDEVLRALLERFWRRLNEPGQLELIALCADVIRKVPEVGRIIVEEVCRPGRQMLRDVLTRGSEPGAPAEEIETIVTTAPDMLIGAALFEHLFRGLDPARSSTEKRGRAAIEILMRGIGEACVAGDGCCREAEGGDGSMEASARRAPEPA